MKKNYLIAAFLLVINFVNAQIEATNYRGAFAPAPTAMWTDTWTNFDPKNETYPDATVVNVSANISANTTWTTGKTYKLTGLIYVINNATLTIQPGVIIKGIYTNSGTALVITKGAKLNAIGTATQPIVFTSNKTVSEGRQAGDWGGVILLGKAGFNLNGGINNIEGITATVNTEYGGGSSPINNDNSGTLKYVRIEFGGYVFSPNNEINGLTFGSVGNGTTIDYVQVSYSGDDSYEWFGGSVNCKHLVAYRGLDDDFDTDNGYKGIVQYALGIKDPSIADNPTISVSEGFESDNNAAGSTTPGTDNTSAIFTNCTLIGPALRATLSPTTPVATGHERGARLRRATQLKIYNSLFLNFKNNYVFIDGSAAVANATTTNPITLKFKNNIIAGNINASFAGGVNPTSLNSWFTTNGNSVLSSSTGLLTLPYDATTNTYLGLDYRPGSASPAYSGADFTDSSISPYVATVVGSTPSVNNVTYCYRSPASPLTATLTTTGVSLRWYTVATGGTFSTTAPTPATTVVGVKNYYVSQVDGSNVESTRVLLTVTTNALPTEVVSAIVGVGPSGSTSAIAVGPYVGTTSTFTYSVSPFADTTLTYLWTVPLGVNIVSGQGTNVLTVNYNNVAYGAGTVGSIQIQAVNANGCSTLAKSLRITKVLPLAPSGISMYDKNPGYATPNSALTTYAKYMGSTTPLTLTCPTISSASSYEWNLPAGVNVDTNGATPVTTMVTYTAVPFFTPGTTPSTTGTKFWVVTSNAYTVSVNGVPTVVTISTATQRIFGTAAYGGTTSAPYLQYGTVVSSNLPSILVNFAGVNSSSTTALYLGVRSRNGVGLSVTNNSANADVVANNNIPGLYDTTYSETTTPPVAPSTNGTSTYTATGTTYKTAKLKKLTAAIPLAPTTVKLFNDAISTTVATTVVSKYIGTTTTLRLLAATPATASSFLWELPTGVNQLSGGNTNEITVNFAGVSPGVTSLYIGAKGVNGIGVSVTNNAALVPATTSTAKLLKVSAAVPAAVSVVTGQITGVCGGNTYSYTITPSLLANSYTITAPIGSVVTSVSNPTNATETLSTSDLTFSVAYPANLASLTTKTVVISAVNGVGASLTNKTLTISTTFSPILTVTSVGGLNFTRCATKIFTVTTTTPGATTFTWLTAAGAVIVNGQGTDTVEIDFSAVPTASTTNLLKVTASNACGVSGVAKSSLLASISCARNANTNAVSITNVSEVILSKSEVYPNPTSGQFNIEVESATTGNVQFAIYSLDGVMMMNSKTIKLEEGLNTISENISNFQKGIYIVKFINSSNKEVMVKKLIKE